MFDSAEQDNVGVCFPVGRLRELTLMPSIIIPYDAGLTSRVIQEEGREEGVFPCQAEILE